jgi:hypothetical protein
MRATLESGLTISGEMRLRNLSRSPSQLGRLDTNLFSCHHLVLLTVWTTRPLRPAPAIPNAESAPPSSCCAVPATRLPTCLCSPRQNSTPRSFLSFVYSNSIPCRLARRLFRATPTGAPAEHQFLSLGVASIEHRPGAEHPFTSLPGASCVFCAKRAARHSRFSSATAAALATHAMSLPLPVISFHGTGQDRAGQGRTGHDMTAPARVRRSMARVFGWGPASGSGRAGQCLTRTPEQADRGRSQCWHFLFVPVSGLDGRQ